MPFMPSPSNIDWNERVGPFRPPHTAPSGPGRYNITPVYVGGPGVGFSRYVVEHNPTATNLSEDPRKLGYARALE